MEIEGFISLGTALSRLLVCIGKERDFKAQPLAPFEGDEHVGEVFRDTQHERYVIGVVTIQKKRSG